MAENAYIPDKVWQWVEDNGGKFANINRPESGSTHEQELKQGQHPLQLYSLATPNGVKITVMLEELLALGIEGAEYDAYMVNILEGEQFGSGFVDINPNSKIPVLVDTSLDDPIPIFESGAILLYLAEKFEAFIPKDISERAKCLSWLFWKAGSAPYLGGGFGHFFAYAPEKFEYPINRFTMEAKRQLDVLDKQLAHNKYICGDQYTIADIGIWPWYGSLALGNLYDAGEFLDVGSYKHVVRWANEIASRPAVQRGKKVNCSWGELNEQLHERHDASDFELKTQDKLVQE